MKLTILEKSVLMLAPNDWGEANFDPMDYRFRTHKTIITRLLKKKLIEKKYFFPENKIYYKWKRTDGNQPALYRVDVSSKSGFISMGVSSYMVFPHISEWLNENASDGWSCTRHCISEVITETEGIIYVHKDFFMFPNEESASMFKMVWG